MTPRQENEGDRLSAEVVRNARIRIGLALSPSGLVVCCFAEVGVALPDDLLALHDAGEKMLGSELLAADLIFRTGRVDAFHPGDVRYGIGHVGICTGEGTVIHASPFVGLTSEDLIGAFLDDHNGSFRGVRRLIARA